MNLGRLCTGVALCLASLSTVYAGGLPIPNVEYSADRQIESAQGTFTQRIYSAGHKERAEMEMGGMKAIMIMDRDKQRGWMLMPSHRMYQEMDLATAQQQSGGAPADDVDITEVGTETVDGMATTKYKLIQKDKSAGGFMWLSKDNVPVMMDMIAKEGPGGKVRVKMTLKNLKIEKQDPALFELPSGYSKMPAMGGMGMMPGR